VIRRHPIALALTLCLVVATTTLAQQRRAPTIDDLIDLPRLESPEISPDGSRVLYVKREIKEWKDNKRVSSIWMVNADGTGAFQFLGHERDRSPRWSPDGRHIAFLGAREARSEGGERGEGPTSQIYLIRADGGEASALTKHQGDIRTFRWAADSSRIFFISADAKTDAEKARRRRETTRSSSTRARTARSGAGGPVSGRSVAERQERRITTRNDCCCATCFPVARRPRLAVSTAARTPATASTSPRSPSSTSPAVRCAT
jgi:dipeptidyl aminopeptidase/acylaminoacyl peptidase